MVFFSSKALLQIGRRVSLASWAGVGPAGPLPVEGESHLVPGSSQTLKSSLEPGVQYRSYSQTPFPSRPGKMRPRSQFCILCAAFQGPPILTSLTEGFRCRANTSAAVAWVWPVFVQRWSCCCRSGRGGAPLGRAQSGSGDSGVAARNQTQGERLSLNFLTDTFWGSRFWNG